MNTNICAGIYFPKPMYKGNILYIKFSAKSFHFTGNIFKCSRFNFHSYLIFKNISKYIFEHACVCSVGNCSEISYQLLYQIT